MGDDAYLVAVTDGEGVPTGYSRCSLCSTEFFGDPKNPNELAINFAVHVAHEHRSPRRRIEDASYTAARIVDEAVRNLTKK